MKRLSQLFTILGFVLSNIMCFVVAYNYRDMLCGIAHGGYSAPAYAALFTAIPYALGIIACIILGVIFKRKAKKAQ